MRRRQEGGRLEAAEVKEAACAGELAEGRGELEEQEAEARAAAGGEELRPEQTCEQLQARINAIIKERLPAGAGRDRLRWCGPWPGTGSSRVRSS